jgi:very-short-patch-repair endonuclease
MKTVAVECFWCHKDVVKTAKEVKRSLKKGMKLFCNNSCGAKWVNTGREKVPTISKPCGYCGRDFQTKARGKYARTFCSRKCASSGSVTDTRREAARMSGGGNIANLLSASQVLKRREAWKYEKLGARLRNLDHEFEYDLGGFVFDLAFPMHKILVEFDGPDHARVPQRLVDVVKTRVAEDSGFILIRKAVNGRAVIPDTILDDVFPSTHVNA